MSLPSPSLTVPTFSVYPQIQFQGSQGTVNFGGAANPFQLRGDAGSMGIEGVGDMPDVVSGDTEAPRVSGQYRGYDKLSGRTITVTLDIGSPFGSYTNMPGAMKALRNALSPPPDGVTEYPFFFQLSSGSPMFCTLVRGRKRSTLIDIPYVLGNLAQNIPIQFWATDPTLYAAGTLDPTVGVPAPLGGFTFAPPTTYGGGVTGSMSFNLSFGGGVEYGAITAVNSGDLPCFPLITFTGPMTTPTLTNASLPNNPFLSFGMVLNTGDTLVVNTDPKYPSAQYTVSGITQSSSRLYTLTQASTWWAIAPGSNLLQFTTQDVVSVAGTCTVEYTSAYSAAN